VATLNDPNEAISGLIGVSAILTGSSSWDWSSLSQLGEDRRLVDGLTSETDLFRRDRREWPKLSNVF
jgi:hypothetical protein